MFHRVLLCGAAPAALALWGCASAPQVPDLSGEVLALRYRIEMLDDYAWRPVREDRAFRRGETIRFRFIGNAAGTLYLLNASQERGPYQPVFPGAGEADLPGYLGAGTRIAANQVGLLPDPSVGGGMRFGADHGRERFLFVFVPDGPRPTRALAAIPAGAEDWDFDDSTTYTVAAPAGGMLVSHFELESR